MGDWKLFDYRLTIERESDAPVTDITSAQQLRQLLEATREDFPGLFILKEPGDEIMKIGLGDDIGYLFWQDRRTDAVAYARNEQASDDEFVWFVAEGVRDEIPAEQVLPFDAVVDAAVHYYQEKKLSDRLRWKIWDPKMKSWSQRPPSTS